ncbi:MAG: glycosyltransferase family 2 protein [Balneolaceae bacterium]
MAEKKFNTSIKINRTIPLISIVIPLLNEAKSLEKLTELIHEALEQVDYEIIFVDDGSTDESWSVIKALKQKNSRVKGIRLQRNYGKSDALQAGFNESCGKYVVTMDADLQDDPAEIPELIEILESGYDLVSGWKKVRHDPLSKKIPSRFFNFVTRKSTGIPLHDFNCGLKAYRREVIESIYLYGELHRYIPLLAKWEGYDRITEKEVKHHPRKFGQTKFGFSRFLHGFLDLVTVLSVNHYMQRPMHLFGTLGVLFLIIGGIINFYLAYIKIILDEPLANRPLLFLGILLVVLGVQFFSIGFLGEMINKGQVKRQKPNIREKAGR